MVIKILASLQNHPPCTIKPALPEEATKASFLKKSPMKKCKVLFTLVLLLVLFVSVAKAKEPAEEILAALPVSIGSFAAGTLQVYDKPGLGASIGYNDISAGIALTLYLYDDGIDNIADGSASTEVLLTKETAINDIMMYIQNTSTDFEIITDTNKELELGGGRRLGVLFTQFSYNSSNPFTGEQEKLYSDLYLTGLKGYFCKIRITRLASIYTEEEKEIEKVVRELLTRLAK